MTKKDVGVGISCPRDDVSGAPVVLVSAEADKVDASEVRVGVRRDVVASISGCDGELEGSGIEGPGT